MEWVAANVTLCRTDADCVCLLQRMMALGIFHNVYNEPTFQPHKGLYSFSKEGRGMLPLLRQRIVAAEDQILGQVKTFNQAQAETTSRLVQLDWRVSIAEQRTHAAEVALRRSLAAQQLLMGTVLAAAVLRYLPLPGVAVESTSAVSVVLLFVALLESRMVLMQFLSLRVRPPHPQLHPTNDSFLRDASTRALVAAASRRCPSRLAQHVSVPSAQKHTHLARCRSTIRAWRAPSWASPPKPPTMAQSSPPTPAISMRATPTLRAPCQTFASAPPPQRDRVMARCSGEACGSPGCWDNGSVRCGMACLQGSRGRVPRCGAARDVVLQQWEHGLRLRGAPTATRAVDILCDGTPRHHQPGGEHGVRLRALAHARVGAVARRRAQRDARAADAAGVRR